ncbi:uncharacterized protein B0T23DRAFT_196819 [Neurospora hispaniola]|uniref:Uncharacterized protein n=1 Tax=Neurospora hispaniola TaxID=588809 RepID=A0AAJ0MPL4_9PEZI|nr:hypothetical protein B0T23DRAFT_196819 [Neurospora hispaniola]
MSLVTSAFSSFILSFFLVQFSHVEVHSQGSYRYQVYVGLREVEVHSAAVGVVCNLWPPFGVASHAFQRLSSFISQMIRREPDWEYCQFSSIKDAAGHVFPCMHPSHKRGGGYLFLQDFIPTLSLSPSSCHESNLTYSRLMFGFCLCSSARAF